MKAKRFFSTAAALLLTAGLATGLAGCSQDDSLTAGNETPANDAIRITATVSDFTGDGPDTRASINEDSGVGSFEEGDVIAVNVVGNSVFLRSNCPATYNGSAWTTDLSWNELPEPSPTAGLLFYGTFPRQTPDAQGRFTFAVQTDQSTAEAYKASELLTSTRFLVAEGDVDFEFTHFMARVKVVLRKGAGVTDEEMAAATVRIHKVHTGEKVDYGGAIRETVGDPATVIPRKSVVETAPTFYALLPMQELPAEGLELEVTFGGKSVTHRVTTIDNNRLVGGLQYPIILTLGKPLTGSVTVGTWDELKYYLTTPGSTEAAPLTIILTADIATPTDTDEQVTVKGYKLLDGGESNHTLTRSDVADGRPLFIDNGNKASLTLRRITLKNRHDGTAMFWFTGEGSHLLLGAGTVLIAEVQATEYIAISNGCKLTLDGATFTNNSPDGAYGSWVSYNMTENYAGPTRGRIVLNDFTFGHTDDNIHLQGATDQLVMQPGVAPAHVRLLLTGVNTETFAIWPTEGSFTNDDVWKLKLEGISTINGIYPTGGEYEFRLHEDDGTIRLVFARP